MRKLSEGEIFALGMFTTVITMFVLVTIMSGVNIPPRISDSSLSHMVRTMKPKQTGFQRIKRNSHTSKTFYAEPLKSLALTKVNDLMSDPNNKIVLDSGQYLKDIV